MNPYRWNAYVIRTYLASTWTPITLAAQILGHPNFYVLRGGLGPVPVKRCAQWFGGDRGWDASLFPYAPPDVDHWPFGFPITAYVLPSTGPP